MQETRVLSLGRENPLEKEMATHSNTLAWRIPWTEEPGRLQPMGSQRVRHKWGTKTLEVKEGSRRLRVKKEMWWCKQQSEGCSGRETWLVTAGFEGGRDHRPRNAGSLWNPEKTRKLSVPWSLQKRHSPANILIFLFVFFFCQWDLFQTSGL